MNFTSLGDLATTFQNRSANTRLKTELQRLSSELSTGRRANASTPVTGDFSAIGSIEHSLRKIEGYTTAISEARLLAETLQSSLSVIQDENSDTGPALLVASNSQDSSLVEVTAATAFTRFETVISALNVRTADRSAFAGSATNSGAISSATEILDFLEPLVAAEVTADGVEAAIDAWFDTPGGGFETDAYNGSTTPISKLRLSDRDRVEIKLTAQDPEIREVLKGFAMAGLVSRGVLNTDATEQLSLARKAGMQMLNADHGLSVVRAEIGSAEEAIEKSSVSLDAETTGLELARNRIVAIDPFKVATELEEATTQLETLYAVTARLSRLSFADYIR